MSLLFYFLTVGNPYVLWDDPHWSALLDYALENGAYSGQRQRSPLHLPSALTAFALNGGEGVAFSRRLAPKEKLLGAAAAPRQLRFGLSTPASAAPAATAASSTARHAERSRLESESESESESENDSSLAEWGELDLPTADVDHEGAWRIMI